MYQLQNIDDTKILDFEKNGYVILPQVLPAEFIERLISAGDYWVNSNHQEMRKNSDYHISDGFRNCLSLDDSFLELIAIPKVLPYIIKLLGYDIKLLTSHLIYKKPAIKTSETPKCNPGWHRDFYHAQNSLGDKLIPRLDIKAAFCLTDLPKPKSGGTLIAPKSHLLKERLKINDNGFPDHFIEPQLKAGDCLLFENRTWHAGAVNLSSQIRKVVMLGYTYIWIKASDYLIQPDSILQKADELYGDVGLQLLDGLPKPTNFDLEYNSAPLKRLVC
ncbi:MAG: hypothetical protein COA79_09665 [Planctomycetota bacterium]|nr:MAG: hypothetical protein COA79_09665 [Planctomycetota bacterium]